MVSKSNSMSMRSEFGSMPRFTAFAVDINGTALARYDLVATEKETAEQEARQYLEFTMPTAPHSVQSRLCRIPAQG